MLRALSCTTWASRHAVVSAFAVLVACFPTIYTLSVEIGALGIDDALLASGSATNSLVIPPKHHLSAVFSVLKMNLVR